MNNKPLSILGAAARTLLGLTFIFSGFVKAVDPLGTVYKIEDYLNAFGGFFTQLVPAAPYAACALILFEFVLGVLLTFNVWTKVTSWLALAMMLVMTPLTLYLAITNPITDCGCFGDAIHLSNWATFGKNVVLLVLVAMLLWAKDHLFATWVQPVNILICVLAFCLCGGLMTYSLLHLPPVDFRPYKIGNNIPELMVVEIPEDAPRDEYEYRFIYEKDGVQQEFTLDNYPKNDSSWVFVEQTSKLIKKGYEAPEPPVHDFVLTLTDEETGDIYDMTDEILEQDSVTLAIMYKIEKASRKMVAKLNRLYEHSMETGMPFYAVTGSGEREVEIWRAETGAEYPILSCDGITLKTIVRANPGIVVLHQGTVADKYNLRNR
ncbi:MAG: DoxX family protein [Bacteroidales bacterium]|jgi:uncharacterized membrane protein YphA (DoxX/SURF4 family)|nr:DoxX family protein [Bacteroidales bacterium]